MSDHCQSLFVTPEHVRDSVDGDLISHFLVKNVVTYSIFLNDTYAAYGQRSGGKNIDCEEYDLALDYKNMLWVKGWNVDND